MSFITKVSFVPRDDGEKSVSYENVDYGLGNHLTEIKSNIEGKFKDFQFRVLNETGSYFDYITILSLNEFIIFHKKFIKLNNSDNSHKLDEFIKTFINSNDDLIRYNWVIVEVFEIDF
jgi:hypothetical protein